MIGKLQTNKVQKALKLFDYIHSVDSYKLAEKIFKYQKILNKKSKLFIQVNVSDEIQKNGIDLKEAKMFVNICQNDLSLNVIGFMCLPTKTDSAEKYFIILSI